MKILLTGGGGFLGGNIIKNTDINTKIISVDITAPGCTRKNLNSLILNLTDLQELTRILEKTKPDVIIHTAALSDIDYCESHQELAEKVNISVTQTLADFCRKNDVKMIHFSSDSVFDGKKGGYVEEDTPVPLHYYGQTKLAGEALVKNGIKRWNVIRPSLIMGLPAADSGNSFLWRMMKALKHREKVAFPPEEIRSPVDALTLSRAVLELAGSEINGCFHLSGNTVVNRYEMARRICGFLKYDQELIEPKKPSVITGRAPRPADVSLSNEKAVSLLKTPMKSLEEGLELIFSEKGDWKS